MGLMYAMFSSLANRFIFQPPKLPFYTLKEDEESKKLKLELRSFLNPDIPRCEPEYLETLDVFKIRTKRGNDIVALYVKNPSASTTVLYSHTNAEDLGNLVRDEGFRKLSKDLRVNVMAYDYSGYGQSTGKPSEKDTYADIEAAYRCLVDKYGAKEEDVILYGSSIGSGPTIDLATRLPKLRGVVVEGGITSVFRVASLAFCGVEPKRRTYSFDIYKNLEKIGLVSSPVLVIHGTDDEIVEFWHGEQLWSHAKKPYEPLWIKGGKHTDLKKFPQFTKRLKKFVADMKMDMDIEYAILDVDRPEEQARNVPKNSFRLAKIFCQI